MAGIWVRAGTVTLTNGSKKVTGSGTAWNSGINKVTKGCAFIYNNIAYEVDYINSDTELYLVDTYSGTTGSGLSYRIQIAVTDTIPELASRIATTSAQVTRVADTSTSAQVTRAADNAVISGANFSQWYKQYEGTITAEVNNQTATALDSAGFSRGCAVISDSTDTNRIIVGNDAGITLAIRKCGTDQSSQTVGSVSVGKHKAALSFVTNNINAAIDAVSATQDVSASIPYLTQLNIGKGAIAGGVWNGHIRSLKYYPKALASAELQAMTA